MHVLPFVLALAVSASSLVSATSSLSSRQAKRSDIIARLYEKQTRALVPRSSPVACAVKDDNNNCCDSTGTTTLSGRTCCKDATFQPDCGSPEMCCSGGASQLALSIVGTVFAKCCPVGTKAVSYDPEDSTTPRCDPDTRKRHLLAHDLATRPVRRGIFDDPARQVTFRENSWRARLSPEMYADFLVDDFEMSYRGHTLIDHYAKASGGRSFRAAKLAEDPTFSMRQAPEHIGDYLARGYEAGQQYLELYRDWELHLDDFPASYRAIVEHPRFEGGIHLHGQYYDEKTLRAIYTKFPTWNATLHDARPRSSR